MLSKIIDFSINQRFVVIFLTILLIGIGIFVINHITIDAFPDLTNNQVQILTEAPGYGPLEVERFITYHIETEMNNLPTKIIEVRSLSKYGLSMVTIVFEDNTNIHFARQLILERLFKMKDTLPPGIVPEMAPISTGLGEIYQYVVSGSNYSPTELRSINDWIISPALRTVQGVAEVNGWGGFVKQYGVEIVPWKLQKYNITLSNIYNALQDNNLNAEGGFIEHKENLYFLRGMGLIKNKEELENVSVKTEEHYPILLKEVADIKEVSEPRFGAITRNGNGEVVVGIIMLLKESNGLDVVTRVKEKLKMIKTALPEGVTVEAYYDREDLVVKVINTIKTNLIEAMVLVTIILLLFLGNIRGALIVASVIPLSLLFSFIGMYQSKLSANIMTLGAIDFGIIVDGSVVMIENLTRRLEIDHKHISKKELILSACHEVAKPILFGVVIIIIVYLPLYTLEDVEGRMFIPMAFTVSFALIGSLILALTYVPACASIILSTDINHKEPFYMLWIRDKYQIILRKIIKVPWIVILLAIIIFASSLFAGSFLGNEFIPTLDEGSIALQAFRLPGTSVKHAVERSSQIEKVVLSIPEVTQIVSRIGAAELAVDPMGPEVSDIYVLLKDKEDWRDGMTKELLSDEIRTKLSVIPGMNYEISQPIQLRVDELISGVKTQVAVKLFASANRGDLKELEKLSKQIEKSLSSVTGSRDVRAEPILGGRYLLITPRRDKISTIKMTTKEVFESIEMTIGGKEVGWIFESDIKKFAIVMRLAEDYRNSLEAIQEIPIKSSEGSIVYIKDIADIRFEECPAVIHREHGLRRIIIGANISGRDIGSFVAEAKEVLNKEIKMPSGYFLEWGGQFENQERALNKLSIIVPVSFLLILVLLFSAFNSVKDTLIIFLNVPLALIGGIFSLLIRGMPLSVSALIGFVALFGVAVLNGIVMITYIRNLLSNGEEYVEAIVKGAAIRLRPVLMTALVASIGFIPMAISTGTGAEVQKPLATVVIGGIISSTLLTLFVLPTIYYTIDLKKWKSKIFIKINKSPRNIDSE